jgi:hypothetical protein
VAMDRAVYCPEHGSPSSSWNARNDGRGINRSVNSGARSNNERENREMT